jgi:hypothetical protein
VPGALVKEKIENAMLRIKICIHGSRKINCDTLTLSKIGFTETLLLLCPLPRALTAFNALRL